MLNMAHIRALEVATFLLYVPASACGQCRALTSMWHTILHDLRCRRFDWCVQRKNCR
jgi:hypothetical protein